MDEVDTVPDRPAPQPAFHPSTALVYIFVKSSPLSFRFQIHNKFNYSRIPLYFVCCVAPKAIARTPQRRQETSENTAQFLLGAQAPSEPLLSRPLDS